MTITTTISMAMAMTRMVIKSQENLNFYFKIWVVPVGARHQQLYATDPGPENQL